jgi:uncharacterized protein YqgV (UPF0045/DUF77 family)
MFSAKDRESIRQAINPVLLQLNDVLLLLTGIEVDSAELMAAVHVIEEVVLEQLWVLANSTPPSQWLAPSS